jgi:hypothetical protein
MPISSAVVRIFPFSDLYVCQISDVVSWHPLYVETELRYVAQLHGRHGVKRTAASTLSSYPTMVSYSLPGPSTWEFAGRVHVAGC